MDGTRKSWLILTVLLICAAFGAGRFSGPAPVKAAADAVSMEVRQVGATTSLVLHYPEKNRIYVYNNPFIGYPKASCAYYFQLGNAGAPIVRNQCPPPESQ
jgi:hypothetical protein